jgi:acetyl-CoA acetyltransferase
MDDYLSARIISDPLGLYDCDVPCDGSAAVIVSAIESEPDLRRSPIGLGAVGTALGGRASWDQWEDLTTMGCRDAAGMMWSRTDLKPNDVDFVWLYDGFTIVALLWLEALGFCGRGEGGHFVESGDRIAATGELPINPDGGQLSGARLHGFGGLHEACRQLWRTAGGTQLDRRTDVAVVTSGACTMCASLVLHRL